MLIEWVTNGYVCLQRARMSLLTLYMAIKYWVPKGRIFRACGEQRIVGLVQMHLIRD